MARFNVTYPTTLVMLAISHGAKYGFEIADVTGLQTGTVYPVLRRLERLAFVRSRWESEKVARGEQRPARCYYELTAAGVTALEHGQARFSNAARMIGKLRDV